MSEALSLLWLPFLVAFCLTGIHAYFGIQVLARGVIFVDLALAQIAALGGTVAFMLGHAAQSPQTYAYSLAFTFAAALLLTGTRVWAGRIPQEALIGVLYVVAAGAAVLLIDRAPQGAEHLKQILIGNILTSGASDLATIIPLYIAVAIAHLGAAALLERFSRVAWPSDLLFYASFGIVVTSSVAIAGVLLVFSFLIVPAAIGALFAQRFPRQLAVAWSTGTLASGAGLCASYFLDLPTGATMVCTFGVALAIAGLLRGVVTAGPLAAAKRVGRTLQIACALVLIASALLLIARPRADQPLFDAIEAAFPSLREAYLTAPERATYADARAYAQRYGHEASRLNALEAEKRSGPQQLDDVQVQRLSSFVRSYAEMQRGEEFVMREVRSRARERIRFWIGLPLLMLGCALAVLGTGLRRLPHARVAAGHSAGS